MNDFCVEHGYEFMRCERIWGAIPYCDKCEASNTRAGAEPATGQADHDGEALGRTVGSIPATGAIYTCLECEANYQVEEPCDECPVCGNIKKKCSHWPGQKRCGVCGMDPSGEAK